MPEPTTLRIREAGQALNPPRTPSALRWYEAFGIIRPGRDRFGRFYTAADIEALQRHVEQFGRKPASKQRRKASK
jgi:hypothetical protein